MTAIGELRIRDPFVLPREGKYYLLGTTGADPWAGSDMMLYVSQDLESLETVGCLLTPEDMARYPGIWAPELHEYRGRFYLFFTCHPGGGLPECHIFASDRPEGPFHPISDRAITPAGWGCLDASFLLWQGKPWLFFTNEWLTPITGDGDGAIYVCPLTEDLTALAGQPRKIVSGKYCGFAKELTHSDGRKGYVAEGAWAVAEEAGVRLYWSTITRETGYCVAESFAQTIDGDYRFRRFVFTGDGGHSMVFSREGRPCITFHKPNRSPMERFAGFYL